MIAMIDPLVAELDKELTEAKTEEKLAQEEHEELTADSSEKRAADSKSLADKEALKADTEDELVKMQDEHKATVKELMATEEYISKLHAECDLSGADFSTRSVKFCKRAREELAKLFKHWRVKNVLEW